MMPRVSYKWLVNVGNFDFDGCSKGIGSSKWDPWSRSESLFWFCSSFAEQWWNNSTVGSVHSTQFFSLRCVGCYYIRCCVSLFVCFPLMMCGGFWFSSKWESEKNCLCDFWWHHCSVGTTLCSLRWQFQFGSQRGHIHWVRCSLHCLVLVL